MGLAIDCFALEPHASHAWGFVFLAISHMHATVESALLRLVDVGITVHASAETS
jgi:hypothetical protein